MSQTIGSFLLASTALARRDYRVLSPKLVSNCLLFDVLLVEVLTFAIIFLFIIKKFSV